jgi:hypothetical protein
MTKFENKSAKKPIKSGMSCIKKIKPDSLGRIQLQKSLNQFKPWLSMLRVSIEPRHRNVLYFEFVMQSHYTSFAVATDKNIPCGLGKLYRQMRSLQLAV